LGNRLSLTPDQALPYTQNRLPTAAFDSILLTWLGRELSTELDDRWSSAAVTSGDPLPWLRPTT